MINTNTADVLAGTAIAGDDYLLGIDTSANEIVRFPASLVSGQYGSRFYVDSVNGSDSNDGTTWAKAKATLDAAVNLTTADKGDVIYVAPKHAETYSTTGTKATFDIAGITVICLGSGVDRATFTFSHTTATWSWTAGGVTLVNALFVTGVDSVVTFMTISGADATLVDVETRDTTDVETIDTFIATGARLKVIRHTHNGYTGGDANVRVWKLNGVANAVFLDCRWFTKVTTAIINFVTTACTNVVARGCTFLVTSTTSLAKDVVDTITGSTWMVREGFDLGFGASFSGGSGNALAGDDLSAVTDALYGANGIATWPAAAAPGNTVSLAEGLRYVVETQIGTLVNTGGTATLGGLIGDLANVSLLTRLNGLLKGSGTAVATNKSLADAIGFDGSAVVTATAGMLRTAAGMVNQVSINITSSTLPNNTQTSGSFTGAAGGAILIEDMAFETDGTGVAGPTNLNITVDNAKGLTGASNPLLAVAVASLGANKTVSAGSDTIVTKHLPFVLESGKKLYASGSSGAGTGAGVIRITVKYRRLADNADIAASGSSIGS